MPYSERLHPWVLVRLLPNLQRVTVGQFRNRSDADGHLEILRRLIPNATFVVMFNADVLQPQPVDTDYRTSAGLRDAGPKNADVLQPQPADTDYRYSGR